MTDDKEICELRLNTKRTPKNNQAGWVCERFTRLGRAGRHCGRFEDVETSGFCSPTDAESSCESGLITSLLIDCIVSKASLTPSGLVAVSSFF